MRSLRCERAGHRHEAKGVGAPGHDRARRAAAQPAERRAGALAVARQTLNRHVDDAQHRTAAVDQPNVDGELAVPAQVFTRAVERIDEPETATRDIGRYPRRDLLFRHHRYLRRQMSQALQDDALGGDIGGGHRRAIGLAAHDRRLAVVTQDHLAGGRRQRGDRRKVDRRPAHRPSETSITAALLGCVGVARRVNHRPAVGSRPSAESDRRGKLNHHMSINCCTAAMAQGIVADKWGEPFARPGERGSGTHSRHRRRSASSRIRP